MLAQHRDVAWRERLVGKESVQIRLHLRHAYRMAVGGDRAVEVGERLLVGELAHLDEHRRHDVEDLPNGLAEDREVAAVVVAVLGDRRQPRTLPAPAAPREQTRGAVLRERRQLPGERQVVAGLEVRATTEVVAALVVDDPGRGVRPRRRRVVVRLEPLRLDEDRPPARQALECVIEAEDRGRELGAAGRHQIGPSERDRLLEDFVLLQHDAGRDEAVPGQPVGEPVGRLAVSLE